jgi:hypothetical protein
MAAMSDTPGVEDVTVEGALGAFAESAGPRWGPRVGQAATAAS